MNYLQRIVLRGFSGVLLALGILSMPLALVHAAGAATIQSLSPGTSVTVGNSISFGVSTSGFTNPNFFLSDSFNGSSISSNDINAYSGNFSWNPISTDVGTHTITITIQDSLGDYTTASQTITVNPEGTAFLSIESVSPGTTVTAGQNLSFSLLASDFSNSVPTYSVSDNFNGSSITNGDISTAGVLNWIPTTNDVGTHMLTITAQDYSGHTANVQEQIIVTSSNGTTATTPVTQTTTVQNSGLVIGNISPGTNVMAGSPLTFTAVSSSLISPVYTIADTFGESTISNADINSSGNFSWTPSAGDVGSHTLTVTGRGSDGTSVSSSLEITVSATSTPVQTTTSTKPTYSFTTSLSLGLQSSAVSNLQTLLTDYGLYSGPITGYFGSLTQTAIESFQAAHGIPSIGSVGPLTLAALNQLEQTTPTVTAPLTSTTATTTPTVSDGYQFTTLLSVGSTGTAVTELQNKLTSLDMYSGPITGYYGTLTQTAVEQFQTAHSISAVGYVGPATRAALNS